MAEPSISAVRVPMIDEATATGRTAELYRSIKEATGFPFVPDMFRLASSDPNLLEVVFTGYRGLFLAEGTLPRETKELIASWVSQVNQCPYCVGTHNFFLQYFGAPKELIDAISTATTADDLPVDEKTRTLLHLVTKVSKHAYKVTDEDWADAKAAGWTGEQVLEAVFGASLFNFITRIVDSTGLGTSVTQSRISQQQVDDQGSAA